MLTKSNPKESVIVTNIAKALERNYGGYVFKVHGGLYQKTGIPDILWWFNGYAFAFEVKRPDESWGVTKLQEYTMALLKAEGVNVAVVHSVKETLDFVNGILWR